MIKVIPVGGHYEAYDDGKFICSGDTAAEAREEAEKEV